MRYRLKARAGPHEVAEGAWKLERIVVSLRNERGRESGAVRLFRYHMAFYPAVRRQRCAGDRALYQADETANVWNGMLRMRHITAVLMRPAVNAPNYYAPGGIAKARYRAR